MKNILGDFVALFVGVDILKVEKVSKILEVRRDKFLNRVFTETEIEYIAKKKFNVETITGLFAGKEAISKALGTGIGKVRFKDMEILHNELGKPIVKLSPEVKKTFDVEELEISISHEEEYAIAFVVGK